MLLPQYGFDYYYTVNGQVFQNKTLAILYANQNKIPPDDIKWHFYDAEFNSVDWTVEPAPSLDEFYKRRARQLREKYDYIILMCTGGADSSNMTRSFLKNGFHVDEIFASAPIEGLRDWEVNPNDKSVENQVSETWLAQIPFLKMIEKEHPSVRITLYDYFRDILDYQDTEWAIRSTDFPHPTAIARYDLERLPHLQKLAETDKKIGVVYGIDKPNIMFGGTAVFSVIVDATTSIPLRLKNFKNFYNECFYWTHDMPQLLVKQSHEVAKWIIKPENRTALKYAFGRQGILPHKKFHFGLYQRAIVPCIYPSLKYNMWQADKHTLNIGCEHDEWFYQKHSSLKFFDMMKSNLNSLLNHIDPAYLKIKKYYDEQGNVQEELAGFKPYTKLFYLGNLDDFKKKNAMFDNGNNNVVLVGHSS